jgi:Mg-chelatase subunit ChlD
MIMKKIILISLVCVLLFGFVTLLFADERTENIDIYLVLDKSLSMEEEIGAVKSYVDNYVIDELMIPGDMFVVIAFYGQTEKIIVDTDVQPADIPELEEKIGSILADGRFTDIGNALDTLREVLQQYEERDRKKFLLLLTDGIQEAPPDSKYYSEDGSFNHAFLENAKTIQQEGWKIQILGIGTGSAAEALAQELSGEYEETSDQPTEEELVEKTKELLGTIEIQGTPTMEPIGKGPETTLRFTVTSEQYTSSKTVTITNIVLETEQGASGSILDEPYRFSVDPEKEKSVSIPVALPPSFDLEPGEKTATLTFQFGGDTVLIPAVTTVSFTVKGFLANNIWIIPVAVIIAAALAVLIVLLIKSAASKRGLSFRLYVDNQPVTSGPVTIHKENPLYLDMEKLSFSISEEKNENSVAELTTDQAALSIKIIDEKQLKPKDDIPEDVLGQKFRIGLKGGYKTFSFKAA